MTSTFKTQIARSVSVFLILLSVTANSQTTRFGISINSLTTNFNYGGSNSELRSYKKNFNGFKAGVTYQAGINSMFSIVPEVYFAMKGGLLKEGNPLSTNKQTVRIQSIELPVLARLHCNNFYVNAGPYVAYAVGGRIKTQATETSPGLSRKISFGQQDSDFKRWDAGAQVGAGYNFDMRKSVLTLDVRYGYGLVNQSNDVERFNRMFQLSLIAAKRRSK